MKQGFSIVELLVGLAIITLVSVGAVAAFRPVTVAKAKFNLTLKAQQLENDIRRGLFYQSNYQDPAGFLIKLGDKVLARADKPVYFSENLEPSEINSNQPLASRISLVQTG